MGTYIDCALTNMTEKLLRSPKPKALQFAVVITDGHVTGSPCGGIKVAAERAREHEIQIFAVAASSSSSSAASVEETGLLEIASSPASVYRQEFKAVELSQGRANIHIPTIERIIKTMVTQTHRDTQRNVKWNQCFSHLFGFVFTETHGV